MHAALAGLNCPSEWNWSRLSRSLSRHLFGSRPRYHFELPLPLVNLSSMNISKVFISTLPISTIFLWIFAHFYWKKINIASLNKEIFIYQTINSKIPSVHELSPAAVRAASLLLHPQSRNLEREKGNKIESVTLRHDNFLHYCKYALTYLIGSPFNWVSSNSWYLTFLQSFVLIEPDEDIWSRL